MTAATLRRLIAEAERQEAEQTLADVCAAAGIGVRALQSKERSADVVKRRAVVAWVLCEKLAWKRSHVAQHLCRTERQVIRLLQSERY